MKRRVKLHQSDEAISAELLSWDQESFLERKERWKFLRLHTEPPDIGWAVPGSVLSAFVMWEAGRCFIGGNFIATVLLIQAFVEHSLARVMVLSKNTRTRKLSFKQLIDAAVAAKEISLPLAAKLHKLRALRNPFVHPADETWPPAYYTRAIAQAGGDPYKLNEADARFAIEVVAKYIRQIIVRWDPYVQTLRSKQEGASILGKRVGLEFPRT